MLLPIWFSPTEVKKLSKKVVSVGRRMAPLTIKRVSNKMQLQGNSIDFTRGVHWNIWFHPTYVL